MNSLSWLLYLAEAFDGVKAAASWVAPLAFLSAAGVGVIAAINKYDSALGGGDRVADPLFKFVRTLVVVGSASTLLLVVAPSKSTIMLIAASEVGETVLASDQVQEIGGEAGALATDSLRVLRKFINEQLGDAE
jgi:hypothetical protein